MCKINEVGENCEKMSIEIILILNDKIIRNKLGPGFKNVLLNIPMAC